MADSLLDLKLFVAVYEERSFTTAAQREHATQSGVSHHVRKLESRLGAQLFLRGAGQRVVPTPAADDFYAGATDVLRTHEAAVDAVKSRATGLQGEVRVGVVPLVARSVLAPAYARFIQQHPNVVLKVVEDLTAPLVERVRTGELHLALALGGIEANGVRGSPLFKAPCLLASRPDGELQNLATVCIQDIQPLRLIAPSRPNAARIQIEHFLASQGVRGERWMDLDCFSATLGLIAATEWMGILPGLALLPGLVRHELTVNPMAAHGPILQVACVQPLRRPLGVASQVFLQMLETEAAQQHERLLEAVPALRQ